MYENYFDKVRVRSGSAFAAHHHFTGVCFGAEAANLPQPGKGCLLERTSSQAPNRCVLTSCLPNRRLRFTFSILILCNHGAPMAEVNQGGFTQISQGKSGSADGCLPGSGYWSRAGRFDVDIRRTCGIARAAAEYVLRNPDQPGRTAPAFAVAQRRRHMPVPRQS